MSLNIENLPLTQSILEIKGEIAKPRYAIGIVTANHIYWKFQTHMVVVKQTDLLYEAKKSERELREGVDAPIIKIQRFPRSTKFG